MSNSKLEFCNIKDSKWYWMLGSSAIALFLGIGSILTCRIMKYTYKSINITILKKQKEKLLRTQNQSKENSVGSKPDLENQVNSNNNSSIIPDLLNFEHDYDKIDVNCMTDAKDWAGSLLSGQTLSGRIMLVFIFIISIASVVLYMYETRWVTKNRVERCDDWNSSIEQQLDFSFNLIFFVYFFVRLIAANDKFWFFFELHSIVDILTVPPAIVSLISSHNWIGLRFLRALRLVSLPDILQYLNIVRTGTRIRLMQLLTLFLTLVLTTAGFIHLVENTGDPPLYSNAQNISYFDAIYYMVVTFSTVGFGDIKVMTVMGKVFMLLFILGGIAVFANSLPEIADIISTRNKYGGSLKKVKPHVVLCGHITYDTVSNFLSDFLHKDREDSDVEIVIIDNQEPTLELEAIIKRYSIQVKFFKGSVMNARDLDRVYLCQADCCLVLTNKYTNDPDSEDAANIMRVISIKNYFSDIKIIIQLIQYHNKAYLLNIPNWKMQHGDDVICLAELKLGFIAVSCLAPGFSTLIANLFTMRSFKSDLNIPHWQNEYLEGAGMELYCEYFSGDFFGLTFHEAVLLAYEKLNLLLIAIQINRNVIVNPDKNNVKITHPSTQGFFIAQSSEEVKRAFHYCSNCHRNLNNPEMIKPCQCDSAKIARNKVISEHINRRNTTISITSRKSSLNQVASSKRRISQVKTSRSASLVVSNPLNQDKNLYLKLPSIHNSQVISRDKQNVNEAENHVNNETSQSGEHYNYTGAFFWVPDVNIDDAILTPQNIQQNSSLLRNHIIVCLFAEYMSPLIGLRNFMFPLRSSHLEYSKLIPVILIGSLDYIKREWKTLMNFPKLYLFLGSPLNRMVLRSVQIERCKVCIILSAKQSMNVDDHSLVDKEAILCSLNIKAMQFDISESSQENSWELGVDVPIITELAIDSNVQFLEQDDDDDPDGEIFMTQPFACGTVFTVSVLDSMMSTAYFNEDALGLIRSLVSGGMTLEFEQLLAEGTGFRGQMNKVTFDTTDNDRKCLIKLLVLDKPPLSLSRFSITRSFPKIYNELFINAVKLYGIICIGIYRRMDLYEFVPIDESGNISIDPNILETLPESNSNKRYVITNPSPNMNLFKSDMIYCLLTESSKFNIESEI